jgi:hypothetical protein
VVGTRHVGERRVAGNDVIQLRLTDYDVPYKRLRNDLGFAHQTAHFSVNRNFPTDNQIDRLIVLLDRLIVSDRHVSLGGYGAELPALSIYERSSPSAADSGVVDGGRAIRT